MSKFKADLEAHIKTIINEGSAVEPDVLAARVAEYVEEKFADTIAAAEEAEGEESGEDDGDADSEIEKAPKRKKKA